MTKEKYKYLPVVEDYNELNLRETLDKYKQYWPWFLGVTFLFLLLSFVYIKYAPKHFTSVASIIVKDEESAGNSKTSNGFEVNLLSGLSANSMANELGLLTSKRLTLNTVKALNLNVQYIDYNNFVPQPLYNNSPIKVQILRIDDTKLKQVIKQENNIFRVKNLGANGLELINETTEKIFKAELNTPIEFNFADFVITSTFNDRIVAEEWTEVLIKFVTIESVAAEYNRALEVELLDDQSTLIQLKIKDRVPKKAEDILNQLIFEYNKEAIEDKNLIAKNTADFIDERLSIINNELDSVESGKESYKEVNRLTDMGAESQMMIENVSQYNQQRQEVETQLEVTSSMLSYMDSNKANLLPANLGLESNTSEFVNDYNDLILERNRLLSGSTEKNPLVVRLDEQIDRLKSNVKQSLISQRRNLKINQENLRKRAGVIGSQIARVPGQERQVRGIERQQNIKESLYLYLLQKREENTLELSVTAPKAKIVDSAYSSEGVINPSPKVVLGIAIILGFLLPFLVIRSKELLNDKIQGKDDLEKISNSIPILGELPNIGKKDAELIKENDRSVLAEAFRILSANLQYLTLYNKERNGGLSIFVTSTIQGEGKTFVATNMAITLALTGKKVVLVGGDLRNPQLQRYQKNLSNVLGVSDYLVNYKQKLSHLFQQTDLNENLTILPSGSIPPNPAELLQSNRLGTMFAELEEDFDYIVVDTAPALLIADTFLINKYAALTLYVTRAGYTKRKLMDFAIEAKEAGKLNHLSLVLNDVPHTNLGYGSKYGYTYQGE
ncbi:tyrosine-protein kinase family protein [uncultured Maribacter sp.]|uniref:GumC family protein n=1 Tax=uncultured Maribacter sp. TaxID=431308 RepID=UPI0026072719|nr:tyrosine-protein kinase family protein [uncultured Maribacter sp.]